MPKGYLEMMSNGAVQPDVSLPILNYCNARFPTGFIVETGTLSDLTDTARIRVANERFIVKCVPRRNRISLVDHTDRHMAALAMIAERVGDSCSTAMTVRFVEMLRVEEGTITLIRNEALSPISSLALQDAVRMGAAIREFHEASRASVLDIDPLPWIHLAPDMERALQTQGRREEALEMLKRVEPMSRNLVEAVVSHNDVHPGNVYYCNGKILFVDLDDACREDFRNDLGMAMTAFSDANTSVPQMVEIARHLLTGYGGQASDCDLGLMFAFALRKAILTEAYFRFIRSGPRSQFTVEDVESVRTRQTLLFECCTSLQRGYGV